MRDSAAEFNVVKFGSETIAFSVKYRARRTIAISVHPDLSVEVSAPPETSLKAINEKIRKRAPWIIKQKLYFERFLPHIPAKNYISGESFRYLGRQYRLRLWKSKNERVTLKNGRLNVFVSEPKAKGRVIKLVDAWYRERAKEQFTKRTEKLLSSFNGHRVEPESIELKVMAKRWGSCTKNGKIMLNPELVKAPASCIEYVLMHELCHLVEHNHSPEYYALLSKMMPDWEERKERLETVEILGCTSG